MRAASLASLYLPSCAFNVSWSVAANPGVDFDFMPHFSAEELVERKMKTAGFEIPEGDVDT